MKGVISIILMYFMTGLACIEAQSLNGIFSTGIENLNPQGKEDGARSGLYLAGGIGLVYDFNAERDRGFFFRLNGMISYSSFTFARTNNLFADAKLYEVVGMIGFGYRYKKFRINPSVNIHHTFAGKYIGGIIGNSGSQLSVLHNFEVSYNGDDFISNIGRVRLDDSNRTYLGLAIQLNYDFSNKISGGVFIQRTLPPDFSFLSSDPCNNMVCPEFRSRLFGGSFGSKIRTSIVLVISYQL